MTDPALSFVPDGSIRLEEAGFARVAALAEREAGLTIPQSKAAMVQSRLSRRLRATGHQDFESYLAHVESASGQDERDQMISALTTNVSHFFREEHHFDKLRSEILPPLLDRARGGGRVRIWSAGCSTGQEPYSLAITLLEMSRDVARHDIRILATDIDRGILKKATSGVFDSRQMGGLSEAQIATYFQSQPGGSTYTVTDQVKDLIAFRRLNLIDPWPMQGRFDVILCRNVVIYFSAATQKTLWPRFAQALMPGGWFFLGHSERIQDESKNLFHSDGITTYRLKTSPND
ncbi:MAG: protein-glutamate O-methyltransferase CheR [Pseudomonadota bacterium]